MSGSLQPFIISPSRPGKMSVPAQEQATMKLIQAMASCYLPLRVLDSGEFQAFLMELNPMLVELVL